MNQHFSKNIHNFIGCDSDYAQSDIVLFGTPFDCTSSYRPGSRFAASAVRNESYSIETYSPYLDRDLTDIAVFDRGDLELPFGNPEPALQQIEDFASQVLSDGKIPLMIGGEHLVTLGAVRAAYKQYPDLRIVHFDAHTDLRDQYLGETLSHATVIRRCHDLVGDNKIFQFGIRSGEREEFLFAEKHQFIHKFDLQGIESILPKLDGKPVYLTVDLDVLDPSVFPGTGTPEAGGVGFIDLLHAIQTVLRTNVVAMDINELSPTYDSSGASTSLTCKLLRETMLAMRCGSK